MVLGSHESPSGGREEAGMRGADSIVRATGEGEKLWFYGGGLHTGKATAEETNNAFLCFEDHMTEGKMTPIHTHPGADEVFYVLEGDIVVHIEGDERAIGPGGFALVARGVPHAFLSTSQARLLSVQTPDDGIAF